MDYRAEQLNLVQQKVAAAEQECLRIQQRIREADGLIEQAFADQQQSLDIADLNPARLQQMQGFPQYIWRLKQQRFQEYQVLQVHERKLLAIREELKQALIKKKSLEILKDKDYTKYRKQIEKAEEEFMAELALNRMARQGTA